MPPTRVKQIIIAHLNKMYVHFKLFQNFEYDIMFLKFNLHLKCFLKKSICIHIRYINT